MEPTGSLFDPAPKGSLFDTPAGEPIVTQWTTFAAGNAFTFRGPAELKKKDMHGTDSIVEQYARDHMILAFDYGMHSNPLDNPRYDRQEIIVDGRKAILARWNGGIGLYIERAQPDPNAQTSMFADPAKPHIGPPVRLSITIDCKADAAKQAEAILRSLRFTGKPYQSEINQ
jgi:hypothetical protein